ncbi:MULTISPECIES: asparaginase [Bacillus]|uniref:asparaginase n=1 Tax=Bacillus wiedmannii TaxID=1890302 RepID=A0A2A8F593_9BACI|nr:MULTISPECIES: asparaginase [Bacillus]KAA0783733.1 asparaginase [Bacillus sp. BPN334]MBY7111040.1 asparaginase [Bacillus sp. 17RED48]MBY7123046.1 asparaginase [Bacillus sp. 16GRE42]MCU5114807.1 asparaginase [Bacillus wiedmannii]MCU5151561.1 asparaginase [Bacillus wiedmannii]
MKRILVLHTGGTIAMEEDKETGVVQPGEKNPLLKFIPDLEGDVDLIVEDVFHLPSPHMTPSEMLQLQVIIDERVKQDNIHGVVITHGTDTLEETAYFLDLTVQATIPIVVTGAMRSSNELGADGLYNFLSAVKVASCSEAAEKGVLVVLNDEIHCATNVTKTHTSNVATFQSPQYGPIGMVTKRGVVFHHALVHHETYSVNKVSKNVVVLKAYAGMDDTLLGAIENLPVDGIVIEALGQGNLPPRTLPSLERLIDKGIPVVLVSRCFNGIVQDVYSYEGGGKQLKDMGIVFTYGLNAQKARIKLLVALENTNSHETIQNMFMHN